MNIMLNDLKFMIFFFLKGQSFEIIIGAYKKIKDCHCIYNKVYNMFQFVDLENSMIQMKIQNLLITQCPELLNLSPDSSNEYFNLAYCEALNLDVGFYLFILLDKTTIDESDKPTRCFFHAHFYFDCTAGLPTMIKDKSTDLQHSQSEFDSCILFGV